MRRRLLPALLALSLLHTPFAAACPPEQSDGLDPALPKHDPEVMLYLLVRFAPQVQQLCAAAKHPNADGIGRGREALLQRYPVSYRSGEAKVRALFKDIAEEQLDQRLFGKALADFKGMDRKALRRECAKSPRDLQKMIDTNELGLNEPAPVAAADPAP